MSVSTTEKINIDVTLSTPSSTVTQNYYPNNVAVSLPGVQGEAGIAGQDGQDGARGPAGPDGNFTPSGPDKAIQFKTTQGGGSNFSGINELSFDYDNNLLSVIDGGIKVGNGTITLTGAKNSAGGDEAIFIKDEGGTNTFRIDSQNKKITFAENSATTEYLMGIGTASPQERLHVANGNLRVDGLVKIGGNIVPLASGVYSLGSSSSPFKDLFIEGDTIHFVNSSAKMGVDPQSNEFSIVRNNEQILGINEEGLISGKISYENIQNSLIFDKTIVNPGERSKDVTWEELESIPKVVCNLTAAEEDSSGNTDLYMAWPQAVTASGYTAVFSSEIYDSKVYHLHTYISPS